MSNMKLNINASSAQENRVELVISGLITNEDIPALTEWTHQVKWSIDDMFESSKNKVKVLVDVQNLEGYTDPEALVVFANLMKIDNPKVLKTATFGGGVQQKMAEDIIKSLSGRENLKSFNNKNEALEWLNK